MANTATPPIIKQQNPKETLSNIRKRFEAADIKATSASDAIRRYSMQKRTRAGDDTNTAKRVTEQSKEIIRNIARALEADPTLETNPIWVMQVEETDFRLVDGHHRLEGYLKAGRQQLPMKFITGTMAEAHLVSDLANQLTQTVQLTTAERSEIAWKALCRLHDGTQWQSGWSARSFAQLYSISSSQADNMVKKLREIGLNEASTLSWKEARFDGEQRMRDAADIVEGWVSQIDRMRLSEEHMEVMANLLRDLADTGKPIEHAKQAAIQALGGKGNIYKGFGAEEHEELEF